MEQNLSKDTAESSTMTETDHDRVYDKLVELWNSEMKLNSNPIELANFISAWGEQALEEAELSGSKPKRKVK